ncbi:P-II family nitrogen regulator [Pseudodesulfovibrio sp. F-1]|uniref:P-II family nitrogen regulator n=1 Tax=Pseudodesulfovibrio alkaliphilus TaxID=2661613 RepID=A0A7K1KPT7_9BACT|nr:P-II family nitrogen regulator [Pseudodesulfovibrio alkaliphilus]MUM77990.1 P-II family nitrogen regulator [Pseudodesulfovibrio alkaliphilus]
MKEVIAVVRMDMMNRTKAALTSAGVDAFFAHEAQGRGKGFVNSSVLEGAESGYEEAAAVLGEKGKLYPKRMVTVVVGDDMVADVVEAITAVNRSGKPGDGKIFVLPINDAVRVRTGEKGAKSIA